jgi:DNA-binding transcriptional ArsR family regulator
MWHHRSMPTALPLAPTSASACCTPLGSPTAMTEQEAADLAVRLKALADPVRLRLLDHLLDQPDHEDCTCTLAPVVALSEPTVSHHLKKLEAAGILTKERRGMSVYYRVVPESIHALAKAIHVDCC